MICWGNWFQPCFRFPSLWGSRPYLALPQGPEASVRPSHLFSLLSDMSWQASLGSPFDSPFLLPRLQVAFLNQEPPWGSSSHQLCPEHSTPCPQLCICASSRPSRNVSWTPGCTCTLFSQLLGSSPVALAGLGGLTWASCGIIGLSRTRTMS